MIKNFNTPRITKDTRQKIADAIISQGLAYNGKVKQADFLNRLYDLREMPSTDSRPQYNNAYKDIHQHADMNPQDWDEGWVFTDERLNLMHCSDEEYLNFLHLTVLPILRENDGSAQELVIIYNKYLNKYGFGMAKEKETKDGAPIFSIGPLDMLQNVQATKSVELKKYLDSDYVHKKIDLMNQAANEDTDVAIGTGKELLETICKSILKQKNIAADKDWTLPQLLKNTTASIDLKPKGVENPDNAERSIKQILGGVSSIVQGMTELRNSYGSGHGKDNDFKGLDPVYAKLFTGMVADTSLFFLGVNGKTELEE
ncbi:abortive infection family protein [Desertivirga brevis]|uniref:abortive infection family protein n=1 Tax=Desertivirga brevis TaxID=2810310 RepID=UPI001A95CAF5|nr:abortive infection family protein [Pedobacter sp. SYSU D00873]